MEKIQIKKVTFEEIAILQALGKQTFFETFAPNNTPENMEKYLQESFALEKLTNELSDANAHVYFALLDEKAIGYLKINFGPSQTVLKDEQSLEIERIYVLADFHGKKVGQILYEKAMQIAQENHCRYVWLGVWEKNLRAIHFYKKNGFVTFDKHIFQLGDDEQTDFMMKLKI